jgi:Zn-dependent peptidase ImmA (M78 family)
MKNILEYADFWNDEKINFKAQDFLKEHPKYNKIPINIESIIGIDLGIDIIPLPGLKKLFDGAVDAYLSADFTSIYVDDFISEKRETRYRFTLAHEIGHMILHPEVYQMLDYDSLDTARTIILELNKSYPFFEKQADEFAGRVLVPQRELLYVFGKYQKMSEKQVLEEIPEYNLINNIEYQEAVKIKVTSTLAKYFLVSSEAITIRLRKERLIH